MTTATLGNRIAQTQYDPEDVRVGQTLQALMFRNEETVEGYIIRRKIKHDELAQNIRIPGKPAGVTRSYVSQLCTGAKHMNNEMLYAIARYLGVNPVAIKRPDLDHDVARAA
jgi:hypothetical protein